MLMLVRVAWMAVDVPFFCSEDGPNHKNRDLNLTYKATNQKMSGTT